MRFRNIGRKTPGHPVLWLLFLCTMALGAAFFAYRCYNADDVDRTSGTPVVVVRTEWIGLIFWGGWSLVAAYHAIRVARVCRRMLERPEHPPIPSPTKTVCPTCGYDLRATPRQCPECGTRFVKMP